MNEADTAGTTIVVTGRLNDGSRDAATEVTVTVEDGTATAGEDKDFVAVPSFTLTIPQGAVSGTATFELTTKQDEDSEGTEQLWVEGSTAPGGGPSRGRSPDSDCRRRLPHDPPGVASSGGRGRGAEVGDGGREDARGSSNRGR